MIVKNAKIASTMLGVEDYDIMSFFLYVEWVGASCGFGGYALDGHRPPDGREGSGHAYQAIRLILDTVGVTQWEKLPGTIIRIEDNGPGGRLTRIGHIMEDRWFDLDSYMKEGVEIA